MGFVLAPTACVRSLFLGGLAVFGFELESSFLVGFVVALDFGFVLFALARNLRFVGEGGLVERFEILLRTLGAERHLTTREH